MYIVVRHVLRVLASNQQRYIVDINSSGPNKEKLNTSNTQFLPLENELVCRLAECDRI